MSITAAHAPMSADYATVAAMVVGFVPSVVYLAVKQVRAFGHIAGGLNRFQRWMLVGEAILVPLAIAAVWMHQHRSPDLLGLGLPTTTPALIALGLGIARSIVIAATCWSDVRHSRTCEDCRREFHDDMLKTYGTTSANLRRFPVYVGALQAAVEEVTFRGFLIWVLTPVLGTIGAVVAAAL
jgi:hypothetical protein